MTTPELLPPRFRRPPPAGNQFEKWWWIFMRVSGALLVVLIFAHLLINLYVGDGVNAIDFAFVAGKWASPLWQWWDLAMLWLAMLHGTNGMRVLVNDYARKAWTRKTLKVLLGVAFTFIVVVGTLTIFTFDPCPVGADPSLLPDFCADVTTGA